MKLSKLLAKKSIRNVRGQGMSEYLIIVALIAVAGIAVMGLFGGAARNQVAGLANEISGGVGSETSTAIDNSMTAANASASDAATNVGLNNYGGSREIISGNDATARAAGSIE